MADRVNHNGVILRGGRAAARVDAALRHHLQAIPVSQQLVLVFAPETLDRRPGRKIKATGGLTGTIDRQLHAFGSVSQLQPHGILVFREQPRRSFHRHG